MRHPRVFGFVGGLVLFVVSFVVLRIVTITPLGPWEIVITALGWIILLSAAVQLTRGWVAATLMGVAELLRVTSERLTDLGLRLGSGWAVIFGVAPDLVGQGLGLIALFLVIRGTVRQWREWRRDEP